MRKVERSPAGKNAAWVHKLFHLVSQFSQFYGSWHAHGSSQYAHTISRHADGSACPLLPLHAAYTPLSIYHSHLHQLRIRLPVI